MGERSAPVDVYRCASHDACWERLIVVRMAGIRADLERRGGEFAVVVPGADAGAAREAIARHDAENRTPVAHRPPPPAFAGAWVGASIYGVVLVVFYVLSQYHLFEPGWLQAGAAQAGLVRQGQLWRAVTALSLHGDVAHLLGNVGFGGLLGVLAGRRFGPGLAWLGIVASGVVGNAINAVVQPAAHASIGASTAVFGALGILAAHAWRGAADSRSRALVRWAPLVSGVLLLGMFGMAGERTDVVAHVTGFGAGIGAGWLLAGVSPHALARARRQLAGGVGALAVVVLAWIVAVVAT